MSDSAPFTWTRSLRFRLTFWYAAVLGLALVVGSLLLYFGTQRLLLQQTDLFLKDEAGRIAALGVGASQEPPDISDLEEAIRAQTAPLRGASAQTDVLYVRLDDPRTGRSLAVSPDLARQPALLPSFASTGTGAYFFAGPDEERRMRVFSQPLRFGRDTLRLQVAVPWDHNADLLERLSQLSLLVVPSLFLSVSLGGWWLIGRALQPISRIVAEAERLDGNALPTSLLPPPAETDSEIGRLVLTLNAMTTRLHHAFQAQAHYAEAQQRFAADASHELRTPLTILRGEMELALSRAREPESYRATLRSATEEIARMSRIVEGLSFLARRDAGAIASKEAVSPIDLSVLARQIVADFSHRAQENGIALTLGTAPIAVVSGNADQLERLLGNLLDNALKFTGSEGCVTVSLKTELSKAVLTVTDTGIGIAEADLPHIFERFWRSDRALPVPGTGLGLAICAQIADAHGGHLTAASSFGEGSVFTLSLPLI